MPWRVLFCVLLAQFACKTFAINDDNVNGHGCNTDDVCLPGAEDIAVPPRTITADNTCGSNMNNPPLQYCPLGQADSSCFSCNSSSNELQHPARFMIDRSAGYSTSNFGTWWQSESWFEWRTFHNQEPMVVNITVSFNKSYVLTGDTRIEFKFAKPAKMVLEKSTNFGVSWTALQYFADDCQRRFGMEPSTLNCSTKVVLCSEKYSDQNEGAVYFSFLNCYTKHTFWDPAIQDILHATDLRITLEFPANDGLYSIATQKNLQQYFYAISDVQVYGRCQCNGHAPNCEFPKDTNGGFFNIPTCMCEHNTAGVDCERCEPLYNNKTWMPATSMTQPNKCERCECYQHADSCSFTAMLGHGVCDDCQHHTTGYFCEQCQDKFYRNLSRTLDDPVVCLGCNCALEGVTNNGSCSQEVPTIGQCQCKSNVTGRRCDRCQDAYYGYTLPPVGNCVACQCSGYGTINGSLNCHQVTGQCSCKNNTSHDRTCSQCMLGFYGFPNTTDGDCVQCICDYGGSTPDICEKGLGKCLCRHGVQGERCSEVTIDRFFPTYDYLLHEAEYQAGNYTVASNLSLYNKYFTGRGYAELKTGQFVKFDVSVEVNGNYSLVLRYSEGVGRLRIQVKGNSTGCPGLNSDISMDGIYPDISAVSWVSPQRVPLCSGTNYTIHVYGVSNFSIKLDSLVLVPELTGLRSYGYMSSLVSTCQENVTTVAGSLASRSQCRNATFSTMVEFFNGSLACGCSVMGANGTTCDPHGGQCPCKQGVMGRTCDQCQPGFYNFTEHGCTPCACHALGSQNFVCDEFSGKCLCKVNVEGRPCDHCELHHYGIHTGQGCTSCNCSRTGSLNQTCDDMTGRCYCKPGVEDVDTDKCDRCQANFFNFTQEGCQACNCNVAGSRSLQCHSTSGHCPCKINTVGMKCEHCANGTFSLEKDNPSGCIPCFCFNRSRECSSADGFILSNIEQNLTVVPQAKLSRRFQGYQLHSYVRLFEVNFSAMINISDVELRLQGQHYTASFRLSTAQCRTLEVGRYCVLLHEKYTLENLDTYQMQRILADVIEATLNITSELGNGADVSVAMGTAIKGDHGKQANHVEDCKCPGRYKELSCQNCDAGFTREIANSNAFVNCDVCFCNNRSETCDGETGVCDNCRLSEGDHCERCGYGVDITTGCKTCSPEFWTPDIHEHGCRACDCVMNNTLYHNSSVCNATSGQCVCKEYVGGRQCQHCAENYYNTTHGCRECPECYGLLKIHVHKLRDLIKDVGITVGQLKTRFSAIENNEFAHRLKNARIAVDDIYDKANMTVSQDPNDLNSTIGVLGNLSSNIDQLISQVEIMKGQELQLKSLVDNISNWTEAAYDNLQRANDSRPLLENLTKAIESFVQPLEQARDTLRGLNETQWRITQNLTTITILQLEKMTRVLLNATRVKDNLHDNTVKTSSLQNETQSSLTYARATRNFSKSIFNDAKAIRDISRDVLKTLQYFSQLVEANRNLTEKLNSSISIPSFQSGEINRNASISIKQSQTVTTIADQLLNKTVVLLDNANDIRQQAVQANDSATKTLQDAITTRRVLNDYQTTSADAVKMANESLKQISNIRAESERSIEKIQNVSESVQDGLRSTDEAMDLADKAYDLSLAENQRVVSVHNKSKTLDNQHKSTACSRHHMESFNTTKARARVLAHLLATCPRDEVRNTSEAASDALKQCKQTKDDVYENNEDVRDVHQAFLESRVKVKEIERAVNAKTHQTRVDTHSEQFKNLRAKLTKLRQAKDKRTKVIKQMKEQVRTMKLEIKDLVSLRDSLGGMTTCS